MLVKGATGVTGHRWFVNGVSFIPRQLIAHNQSC